MSRFNQETWDGFVGQQSVWILWILGTAFCTVSSTRTNSYFAHLLLFFYGTKTRQDDCLGGWVGLHHDSRSIVMAGESAPGSQLKSMNRRQDDCLGVWVGLRHDSRSIIMAGESAPGSQLKSMNCRQDDCLGVWVGLRDFSPSMEGPTPMQRGQLSWPLVVAVPEQKR